MGAHSSAFLSVCTCNRFSKARTPHHLLWVNPIGDAHPITRAASRELQLPDAAFDESTERVDCVRDREPQRRRDPDPTYRHRSNASGIIVSASMVRIAPAAKARTKPTVSGEECWNRP